MWKKRLATGQVIYEDRERGVTWLKSPTHNIISVQMINRDKDNKEHVSAELSGFKQFWHSRTAFANQHGQMLVVAERIQALMESGKWLTITWNGQQYKKTIEDKAIGKPIR